MKNQGYNREESTIYSQSCTKAKIAKLHFGASPRWTTLPLVTALLLSVGGALVPASLANSSPKGEFPSQGGGVLRLSSSTRLATPLQTAQVPANAKVIYVNPALGKDNASAGGAESAPLRTITYALQQAQSGTVIQLATGSYTSEKGESFPLAIKSGVILRGDESNKGEGVLIIGGGSYISPTFANQNVTLRAEKNSEIIGVTVTNPNTRGTGLWIESTNPKVSNSTFSNSLRDGIFVSGTGAPTIENNIFAENKGNGVSVARAAKGEIRGNLFQNTGFGITIGDTSSPIIEENRIIENKDGVVVSNSAKPVLRNNTIENNSRDGIVAIANAAPDLGTSESEGKNYIRNNSRYDLYNATTSNTIVAVGNDINENRIAGKVDFVAKTVDPPTDGAFKDIAGNWAETYIQALAAKKIIAGFNDGTFRPNEPVTRAQFAAIINKAFAPTAKESCTNFADVGSNFWGFQAIQTACEGGFLAGYPGGEFRAEQRIPRVQVLVALASGLELRSEDTSVLSVYADNSQIPEWATTAIAGATQRELVVNYPNRDRLNPDREATRAEVAAFVYQALVNAGKAEAISSPYLVLTP